MVDQARTNLTFHAHLITSYSGDWRIVHFSWDSKRSEGAACHEAKTSLPKVIWEEGRVAAKVSPNCGTPEIRPKKYSFPWTDPQTQLCASSLDPSDLWCQTASGSDPPFFHNALDRPMHRRTDRRRRTDPRESLMTIARYASNESDAA